MLARKLENCPAADELPIVAEILADDLIAAGYGNDQRVASAIEHIGRNDLRWPQPARVIEAIKECGKHSAHTVYTALPPPERTPEQMERINKLIADARKSLR